MVGLTGRRRTTNINGSNQAATNNDDMSNLVCGMLGMSDTRFVSGGLRVQNLVVSARELVL